MKKVTVRVVQEWQIPEDHLDSFLDSPADYTAEYDWFPYIVEAYEVEK